MDLSLEVREHLAEQDETFRELHREHQTCEERLASLQSKFGLSVEEELEEKRLKKQKLHLKDRMDHYIRANGLHAVAAT